MTGIFRKDVFVLRKQLILIVLSVIGFVALSLLICGSFRYGNLAKLPEKDYADAFSSLTMLFGPLAAVLAELSLCTAFNGTISSDRKNGWYAFTSSLPLKKSSIALAKLFECVASAVLAAVVGVSATVGCYLIAGRTLSFSDILVPLLVVCIVLFVYMLPLFYVFRGKDTASFFVIVVLFVAVNAVFAVISSDNGIGFAESADKLISKLPLICLALLAVDIVTFFVSWRISTSLLRKCDK